MIRLIIVVAIIIWTLVSSSVAAPPPDADPKLQQWFENLKTPEGGSCCNIADCRPVDSRIVGDHFEAYYNGEWIPIPPARVRPQPSNPLGRAVICIWGDQVLCFVPPLEV